MLPLNDIYHGDCINLMLEIESDSIDMILCDLPYGTTKCKWDVVIPFEPLWKQYKRIIRENGVIVLTGTEPFSSYLRLSGIDIYRYDWYWHKDKGANFLFANKQPLKVIETISVFYKKQPKYNPQKRENPNGVSKRHLSPNPSKITKNVKDIMGNSWKETVMGETQNYHGKNYEPDKLLPTQLIYCPKEQKGKIHPTQKPVKLFEYLIQTYTDIQDVVLDNCAGSGTTGVACQNTNRNFILMEKSEEYYLKSKERIKCQT